MSELGCLGVQVLKRNNNGGSGGSDNDLLNKDPMCVLVNAAEVFTLQLTPSHVTTIMGLEGQLWPSRQVHFQQQKN